MRKGKNATRIGRAPLDGYDQISRQELAELKKLSVKEAVRRLEILLKEASKWRG
ncbi:MAG: hypothetical protein HY671_00620 [Chloroflexi bacterium]|nr:hypothetical protein [Chloroflexota bacterium]